MAAVGTGLSKSVLATMLVWAASCTAIYFVSACKRVSRLRRGGFVAINQEIEAIYGEPLKASYRKRCMGVISRFKMVLVLIAGCLFGSAAIFAALLAATESASAALTFTVIAFAFALPVVSVFFIACLGGEPQEALPMTRQQQSTDAQIAAAYALCTIPFWFSAAAFLNGSHAAAAFLCAVYLAMAALPLRSMLRLARRLTRAEGAHQGARRL
jgi:hypothetical protein